MIFPVLLFGAVMLVIAWSRLRKAEAHIDGLAARVGALEAQRPPGAGAQPTAAPTAAEPPHATPSSPQPIAPPPPLRPAAIPVPGRATVPLDARRESLETRIGARWLLYVGVVAIIVGVSYFEKLAIDNGWIGETARVLQGAAVGSALVYAGRRFARAGYALYGQVICGGGIAVLYVSTYAAFNLYGLISRPSAFALMCAITGLAAWLADRERSEALALMAVGGGFLTPFLLPGDTDAQLVLFSYDAILAAGTMYLAHRRQWPALNAVSYVFTAVTIWSWASRFYAPSKYLATELFLTLFCAMYLYILRETRRAPGDKARLAAALLWTAPAAYYIASIGVLSTHSIALLIFLITLAAIGAMVAARAGSIVRLVFWIAVAAPLMPWAQNHSGLAWLIGGLAAVAAVYVIYLAAHLEWTARGAPALAPADIALLHLNGLWVFGCAYMLLETTHVAATAPLAAALALLQGGLAYRMLPQSREHALHFAALGFTLLMVAIALQFDGPWVTSGWAAEGAVVMALGLREKRDWLRAAGMLLFAVAIGRLLQLLFAQPRIDQVVLVNRRAGCGLALVALTYWIAWIHRRAGAISHARAIMIGVVTAQVLTLAVLTSEIDAYWEIHATDSRSFVARGLMLSLTWALYATVAIVIGIRKEYAPVRYFAIGLFAVTIVKVFGFDLATLDRIYRVSSIIGLGVLLLVTSYFYQRFRQISPADHPQ